MSHRFPGAAVLLPSAAAFVLCVEAAFGAAVKVTKSGQGIYAKADETKKAATLPAGTVMEVRNASSAPQGWVQVSVPACVDLWIFADSVNNGVVSVTTGRVRSSTSATAPEVARLPRGSTIVVRGKDGDWFKIAPPISATMWVKSDSVAPTSEAPARIEETSVPIDSSQNASSALLTPVVPAIPTPVASSTPPPAAPTPPTPPPPAPVVSEVHVAAAPTPAPAPVAPAPAPVVTVPAPTPSTPPTPVTTTTSSAPEPIVPAWRPSETTDATPASAKSADKPDKPADKPTRVADKPVDKPVQTAAKPAKPVAVAPSQKPVAVTPTTRPPARSVVFPAKPATTVAQPRPASAPTLASSATAPAPVASGASWEKPASSPAAGRRSGAAAPRQTSVARDLAGVAPNQTYLPKVLNDVEWSDPTPGTLLPNRRSAAITARVPQAIAGEKLSPTYVQGKAGRAVGMLVHEEGGLFSGSRYEILQLSDDGTASGCLAIVIGEATALNPLVDRAVRIDGTVWWLRSSTPLLAVESIAPLR